MGTVFSTYDIRGRSGETLTVEYVWNVGKAFAEWIQDEGAVVLVKSPNAIESVGHAFVEGVLLQGRDVIDVKEGDHQAVVNAINENTAVGGAHIAHDDIQNIDIITLFDNTGTAITAESGLTSMSELIDSGNFLPAAVKGTLVTK